MKTRFIVLGKTNENYLAKGIDMYLNRIDNYVPFEYKVLPDLKQTRGLDASRVKELEGEMLLETLSPGEELILLDERGETFSSLEFARFVQKKFNSGKKSMVFAVGGPYGFSAKVHDRSNARVSLSSLTFSHQMVRLVFLEQFYRAMTILKGEPYHHE